MRITIESLKRLYKSGRITKEQVAERVTFNRITEQEYKYITGEDYILL